jgi:hypothetical protein
MEVDLQIKVLNLMAGTQMQPVLAEPRMQLEIPLP